MHTWKATLNIKSYVIFKASGEGHWLFQIILRFYVAVTLADCAKPVPKTSIETTAECTWLLLFLGIFKVFIIVNEKRKY